MSTGTSWRTDPATILEFAAEPIVIATGVVAGISVILLARYLNRESRARELATKVVQLQVTELPTPEQVNRRIAETKNMILQEESLF